MKSFIKFVPAALALVALASCSNDDLFGNGNSQEVKGALTVNVAPLNDGEAVTRAANIPALNNDIDWQNGDQINVYDEDLSRFDEYSYQGNVFGLKDASQTASNMRNTMTYALFPADRVDYHGWSPADGPKAVIRIPEKIVYNSASEYQASNNTAYVSNLPMFGTVTSGSTFGNVEVGLSWLTAVLRIQLNDAFANLSYLKIETDVEHPITGAFEALLDKAGVTPQLQVGTNALENGTVMYIDVRKVPAALSYIYVPVVAGSYQKFTVSTAALAGNENVEDPSTIAAWTVLRDLTTGFTFNTGSIYRISKAYDLTGVTTCEMLSKALKQYKTVDGTAGKLTLNVGGATGLIEARNSDVDTDNTIWVPNMKASTLEINIPATTGIQSTLSTNVPLVLADVDPNEPYEGTVIINTPMIAGTSDAINVQVNMPKAKIVFAGADLTGLSGKENTFQIDAAKDFVFGDGTTATVINTNASFNFVNVETVTVAANATITPTIDVEETQNISYVDVQEGGTANAVYVKDATVYVTGTINTVVDSYTTGRTYIGYDKDKTAGTANGNVGTLMTFGDVYIANKSESEAISTELDLYANNNVYLKQGYVKKIDYNTTNYPATGTYQKPQTLNSLPAADLAAKEVNIYLDNIQGEGLTAIAEIANNMLNTSISSVTYNFVKLSESKWGGKAIGGGTGTSSSDATTYKNTYAAATTLDKIYTASELASIDQQLTVANVLYNDINLNNLLWTPQKHNANFDGADPRYNTTSTTNPHGTKMAQYHTIKNMNLGNITGKTSYGLFESMSPSANVEIKNFIVNGVTTALAASSTLSIDGVGVVVGTVTNSTAAQTVTFDNIKIEGTNNIGTDATITDYVSGICGTSVGGIVGKAKLTTATANALVIKNCAVTLNEIKGHAYVGGLVGKIEDTAGTRTAEVDLGTANTVAVTTFTQKAQPTDTDLTYFQFGTFGIFVGTAQAKSLKVPYVAATDATKAKLKSATNKAGLGFKYNHYTNNHVLYRVAGGCPEVGFSADMTATTPATTLDNLTVGTYVYPTASLAPKFVSDFTNFATTYPDNSTIDSKRFNIYVKNGIWDDAAHDF